MQLVGEQRIPADQRTTWEALNDPEVLRQCIPGCDALTEDGEHAYRVDMSVRIGPISAKFKGRLRLLDIQAPTSYSLEFEGQGGAAGSARARPPSGSNPRPMPRGWPIPSMPRSAASWRRSAPG